MSNMSYCRFQNTKMDLEDCAEALEENGFNLEVMEKNLSADEFQAAKRLIELCRTIVEGADSPLDKDDLILDEDDVCPTCGNEGDCPDCGQEKKEE